MSVWVIAEHRNGHLREITGELLGAAKASGAGPVTAVVLSGPDESGGIVDQVRGPFDHALAVEHPLLAGFNGAATAEALEVLARERSPRLILGAHSAAGMDWAPSLAARLGAPVATDVLDLQPLGDGFTAVRAVYGGKLLSRVHLPAAPAAVVTVRSGSYAPQPTADEVARPRETVQAALPDLLGKRFLEWLPEAGGEVDITQADVLVSVGRGIGDAENLEVGEALADALGATVSCSRPVVDSHWLPKERQVGISGKTVKPKVYIALGISGAFQHVTAMKGAGLIVAVNKDPNAPIFQVAHYAIVGDLFQVVPALTRAVLEARRP